MNHIIVAAVARTHRMDLMNSASNSRLRGVDRREPAHMHRPITRRRRARFATVATSAVPA